MRRVIALVVVLQIAGSAPWVAAEHPENHEGTHSTTWQPPHSQFGPSSSSGASHVQVDQQAAAEPRATAGNAAHHQAAFGLSGDGRLSAASPPQGAMQLELLEQLEGPIVSEVSYAGRSLEFEFLAGTSNDVVRSTILDAFGLSQHLSIAVVNQRGRVVPMSMLARGPVAAPASAPASRPGMPPSRPPVAPGSQRPQQAEGPAPHAKFTLNVSPRNLSPWVQVAPGIPRQGTQAARRDDSTAPDFDSTGAATGVTPHGSKMATVPTGLKDASGPSGPKPQAESESTSTPPQAGPPSTSDVDPRLNSKFNLRLQQPAERHDSPTKATDSEGPSHGADQRYPQAVEGSICPQPSPGSLSPPLYFNFLTNYASNGDIHMSPLCQLTDLNGDGLNDYLCSYTEYGPDLDSCSVHCMYLNDGTQVHLLPAPDQVFDSSSCDWTT